MSLFWIIPAVIVASWVVFNVSGWISVRFFGGEHCWRFPFSYRIFTMGPWYVDWAWDRSERTAR